MIVVKSTRFANEESSLQVRTSIVEGEKEYYYDCKTGAEVNVKLHTAKERANTNIFDSKVTQWRWEKCLKVYTDIRGLNWECCSATAVILPELIVGDIIDISQFEDCPDFMFQ